MIYLNSAIPFAFVSVVFFVPSFSIAVFERGSNRINCRRGFQLLGDVSLFQGVHHIRTVQSFLSLNFLVCSIMTNVRLLFAIRRIIIACVRMQ